MQNFSTDMSLPNNLQLCRLCLFEKNSYVDIFEINEKHGFRIADVINEMLELDVSPGDGFPDRICHDCLNEMARFKRFKNLCQEAKLTLKYIIALATGAMPPPTTLPSFLNAAQNNITDAKKGASTSLSSTVPVSSSSSLSVSQPLSSSQHLNSPQPLSSSQPLSSISVPLSSNNVPLSSNNVLLSSNNAPLSSNNVPLSSNIVPLSTNNVPLSSNTVPLSTTHVPLSTTHVPLSTAHVPLSTNHVPLSTNHVPLSTNHVPLSTNNIPLSSVEPPSSTCVVSSVVSTSVQVNIKDGAGSSTANNNFVTSPITQPPPQFSANQVDSEQQTVGFVDGQEDSDIENLCDEPLPVETVLSEPDSEMDHGNRILGGGIAVLSQNGEREDSFGMFPISSIINDLHQFSSYIPPGTRIEHSIFDKAKEPEVVDLVDDDEDDEDRRNAYPLAQTLASPCNESGNSRPGSDTSVIIKTEGNEDSDLENMCEHPLPVETVLSEPDGDISSVSGIVKSENSHNAVEGRDDALGLFSLTSTFSDLMASTDGVGNSCLPRNPIIHGEQLPQNNISDGVARPLENPNKYPFWCPICGKNFMRKDKLKQHSVVHSNERPFICRICGCSYKRKDKLTSHVTSSHLQHLPFQCDICGKRFVRKDKLKQHGVVHSNRRPYACKECGKRYKSKTEQKKHEKRAHSQDPPL